MYYTVTKNDLSKGSVTNEVTVECYVDGNIVSSTDSNVITIKAETSEKGTPYTGDPSCVMLWGLASQLSGFSAVAAGRKIRRKRK